MAKTGRPRIKIDWGLLDDLCGIQCTQEEIAAVLHCSADTIARAVEREKGVSFAEYFEEKKGLGRVALRRLMRQHAQNNVAAAIFLSKNELGMSDVQKVQHTGDMKITHEQFREELSQAFGREFGGGLSGTAVSVSGEILEGSEPVQDSQ